MTPAEVAAEVGVSPRALRQWLRDRYGAPENGHRWQLTTQQVDEAWAAFAQPRTRPPRRRADYVLSLVDEVTGVRGLREHRFDWLRGDTGHHLPVDWYSPELRLVVEVHEEQHDQPVVLFDRRSTVSGMDRAAQRARYDRRREQLAPLHGLTLVVVKLSKLDQTPAGRLRRSRHEDITVVRHLLACVSRPSEVRRS
jgi:hypothetical protein